VDASLALLLLVVLAIARASDAMLLMLDFQCILLSFLDYLVLVCIYQMLVRFLDAILLIHSSLLSLLLQLDACHLQLLIIPGELLMLLLVCACSGLLSDQHVLVFYLLAHYLCLLFTGLCYCLCYISLWLHTLYWCASHACMSRLDMNCGASNTCVVFLCGCCCCSVIV
jgi:hypothetical protein